MRAGDGKDDMGLFRNALCHSLFSSDDGNDAEVTATVSQLWRRYHHPITTTTTPASSAASIKALFERDGFHALSFAAAIGNVTAVRVLVRDFGIDPAVRATQPICQGQYSALARCCSRAAAVQYIALQSIDDVFGQRTGAAWQVHHMVGETAGSTALHWAALFDRAAVVNQLAGAAATGPTGAAAIFLATDDANNTAQHYAAAAGSAAAAAALLNDVFWPPSSTPTAMATALCAQNDRGYTALQLAVEQDAVEIIRSILDRAVALCTVMPLLSMTNGQQDGITALHMCRSNQAATALLSAAHAAGGARAVAALLMAHTTWGKCTPLHSFPFEPDAQLLALCFDSAAEASVLPTLLQHQNAQRWTLLHVYAHNANPSALRQMLSKVDDASLTAAAVLTDANDANALQVAVLVQPNDDEERRARRAEVVAELVGRCLPIGTASSSSCSSCTPEGAESALFMRKLFMPGAEKSPLNTALARCCPGVEHIIEGMRLAHMPVFDGVCPLMWLVTNASKMLPRDIERIAHSLLDCAVHVGGDEGVGKLVTMRDAKDGCTAVCWMLSVLDRMTTTDDQRIIARLIIRMLRHVPPDVSDLCCGATKQCRHFSSTLGLLLAIAQEDLTIATISDVPDMLFSCFDDEADAARCTARSRLCSVLCEEDEEKACSVFNNDMGFLLKDPRLGIRCYCGGALTQCRACPRKVAGLLKALQRLLRVDGKDIIVDIVTVLCTRKSFLNSGRPIHESPHKKWRNID